LSGSPDLEVWNFSSRTSLAHLPGQGQNVAGNRDKVLGLEEASMNVAAILKMKGKGVFTASADTSLLEIAKLLEQHGIGCIVVEADEGKVVGIVSERDVVRAIGRSGTKVLKDRLMSEMTTHRFRHMPVVERGRLIGLVSIGDVVKMRIAEAEMEAAAMREYIATG
jgi:predicted transcriptional regulator